MICHFSDYESNRSGVQNMLFTPYTFHQLISPQSNKIIK